VLPAKQLVLKMDGVRILRPPPMRKEYDFRDGVRNPYYDRLSDDFPECTICKRKVPPQFQEKHHLVPKSRKGKKTILVCSNCGNQLHKLFTNREMERTYHTVEAIIGDERVQKWIKWVGKRKSFRVPTKTKKKR